MSEMALRPRYRFRTTNSVKELSNALGEALKDKEVNQLGLGSRKVSNHLIISFPVNQRHFWSPALDVNFEKQASGKTLVRVLIGPEPSIWTMFMFFYALGGLAVVAGMVLGYSQWTLGHGLTYLILIPIGGVIILLLYFAALSGKSKAKDQMKTLKDFLEQALGQPVFHEEET